MPPLPVVIRRAGAAERTKQSWAERPEYRGGGAEGDMVGGFLIASSIRKA